MATHPALYDHDSDVEFHAATDVSKTTTAGLLGRIFAWYAAKAHAERDAEIASFIEDRGGQFTDEMEREISRRFGGLAG
jgi:hypothetical protein